MTALRAVSRQMPDKPPIRTIAPMGMNRRVSSESAWPLRAADGRTFAERKER